MSRETTDTSANYGNKDIEDGNWDFTIVSCTKKYGGTNKDTPFYVWKLKYEKGDGEQILLPSMMGGLLRALGAKEELPNVFTWDTEDYNGKRFNATVSHEPDKKDPSKMRQKMGHFQLPMSKAESEIPF